MQYNPASPRAFGLLDLRITFRHTMFSLICPAVLWNSHDILLLNRWTEKLGSHCLWLAPSSPIETVTVRMYLVEKE